MPRPNFLFCRNTWQSYYGIIYSGKSRPPKRDGTLALRHLTCQHRYNGEQRASDIGEKKKGVFPVDLVLHDLCLPLNTYHVSRCCQEKRNLQIFIRSQ